MRDLAVFLRANWRLFAVLLAAAIVYGVVKRYDSDRYTASPLTREAMYE